MILNFFTGALKIKKFDSQKVIEAQLKFNTAKIFKSNGVMENQRNFQTILMIMITNIEKTEKNKKIKRRKKNKTKIRNLKI